MVASKESTSRLSLAFMLPPRRGAYRQRLAGLEVTILCAAVHRLVRDGSGVNGPVPPRSIGNTRAIRANVVGRYVPAHIPALF